LLTPLRLNTVFLLRRTYTPGPELRFGRPAHRKNVGVKKLSNRLAGSIPKTLLVSMVCLFPFAQACGGQAPDTSLVRSSDPDLAKAAARLLPALAERAGLSLVAPVRVERRSREELERYLRYKLDEEFPKDRAEYQTAVYAALGLVPDDLDLHALLLDLYLEQVAGFYDPDSTALFVIDDQPPAAMEALLMHELVHAIQDQTADLDAITDPKLGNDRVLAASAAIEGHATLVMFEYALEQQQGGRVDLTRIPNFAEQFRPALETLQGQSPTLAGAPAIIRESLLFPYFGGASFIEALWKGRNGRPAPFGRDLPASTEEILHPERFLAADRIGPEALAIRAPEGWKSLFQDGLGEFELRIMLEEQLGPLPQADTEGWDGDRYALLEDSQGRRAVVWISVWADRSARDRVAVQLDNFVKVVGDARVERSIVGGKAAVMLLIDGAPRVAVSLDTKVR
jgi:hypothetical protein